MKKILSAILAMLICLAFAMPVLAEEEQREETTIDASQPRLMLSSYEIENGSLSPDEKGNVTIVLKNYSSTKAVSNIKLSVTEESGEIKADGTGTQFVSKIKAGGTYKWTVPMITSKTASTGEHRLIINMEYEDMYYSLYSAQDSISINVTQTVALDYDNVLLPVKATQGDTITISPNMMNTGKSLIRNCRLSFDIEGLESGGVLFIGEIEAGESKSGSANLRVSTELLGEVNGTITIDYEDEFGNEYSEKADVSTIIEEKIEIAEAPKEEENKNPLWWLFLSGGIIIGGAIGFGVPTAIRSGKQRKEDEMRL